MGVCCPFTHTKQYVMPHTALLNNIGLVLYNQIWHTRHVIIVHMKLSELYSVHSTSRSCLPFLFMQSLYAPPQSTIFKCTCTINVTGMSWPVTYGEVATLAQEFLEGLSLPTQNCWCSSPSLWQTICFKNALENTHVRGHFTCDNFHIYTQFLRVIILPD